MRDFMSINSIPKIHEPRKLSEAFDFKRGERFEGTIKSASTDSDSVNLKLKDGTQISAKLESSLKDVIDGLTKFEVVGFERGQVKIKVVNDDIHKQHLKTLNDSLELLLNKFGLEQDKKQVLEKMLKFSILITKENVEYLNTLTEFRDKAITNSKDIKGFIDSYIASKGNEILPEQKQVVESKLNEFFKSFSGMSDNDILFFLENDMTLNTENIKAFSSVIKEDSNIFKELKNAIVDVKALENNININSETKTINEEGLKDSSLTSIKNSNSFMSEEILIRSLNDNNSDNTKEINKNDIDISNNLKKVEEQIKNVKNEFKSLNDLGIDILKNNDSKEVLKSLASNLKEISKEIRVSEKLTTVLDKVIKNFDSLDKSSMDSLKNVFEFAKKECIKLDQDVTVIAKEKLGDNIGNTEKQIKELDLFLKDFKEVKMGLIDKQEQMKEAIKILVDKVASNNERTSQMVIGVLRDKIADFKMFNDLSNEYYYLDVPLNMKDQEYPCKLIIKDDRKDGKKLDKKNIKLAVSVKTVNIGSVDALINLSDKNIKIELKVLKQNMNLLEKNKNTLHKALEQLSFMPYIFVSEKKEMVESSISDFREFFSDGNTLALDKKV
ncbi:MAG: hypothetical protein ACRCTZ_11190 [Sarcina sp.]